MSFVRFTPVMRFYWDGLRSITPVIRSYRYVLRSITPAVCRIAPNRAACGILRSCSAVGRDRHSCVLAALFGYLPLWVHFGLVRFFMAIPTENERNEGTRRTESAAQRLCAFA